MWWWQSVALGGALVLAGAVPVDHGTCWASASIATAVAAAAPIIVRTARRLMSLVVIISSLLCQACCCNHITPLHSACHARHRGRLGDPRKAPSLPRDTNALWLE